MGGKGVRDNVVQFVRRPDSPSPRRDPGQAFLDAKPEPEPCMLSPMPARPVDVHEAVRELKKVFGGMIDETVYVRLAFPTDLFCARFDDGIEIYDAHSRRPGVRSQEETLAEEASWVKSWYFSVFRHGDRWTARYIDRIHPDVSEGRRLGEFEQVVRDPATGLDDDGLKDFIRRVKMRV